MPEINLLSVLVLRMFQAFMRVFHMLNSSFFFFFFLLNSLNSLCGESCLAFEQKCIKYSFLSQEAFRLEGTLHV